VVRADPGLSDPRVLLALPVALGSLVCPAHPVVSAGLVLLAPLEDQGDSDPRGLPASPDTLVRNVTYVSFYLVVTF